MIYHFWRKFPGRNPSEDARCQLAQSSWPKIGRVSIPILGTDLPRLFQENDTYLPYVKDVFDFGVKGLPDDAMLVFTATDVGFSSRAFFEMERVLASEDAGDANRQLFPEGMRKVPSDAEIEKATRDSGKGMWFFRAHWWRRHRDEFPDMLLPRTAWDWVIKTLIKQTAKFRYVELVNCCWHQEHPRLYHDLKMHGNRHNTLLARKFLHEHGMGHLEHILHPEFFGCDFSKPYRP